MAKEKIKDVEKAFRDSHSKGIVFTDNNKYEQAKKRKFERRKAINEASRRNAELGSVRRELKELKNIVNKLVKENKPKAKSKK